MIIQARSPVRTRPGTRLGVITVEFLLVVPLLTFVLVAGIDLARLVQVYSHVAGATHAALTVAGQQSHTDATRSQWERAIRAAARENMESMPGFDESNLVVVIYMTNPHQVEVTVQYPFRPVLPWSYVGGELLLEHRGAVFLHR